MNRIYSALEFLFCLLNRGTSECLPDLTIHDELSY